MIGSMPLISTKRVIQKQKQKQKINWKDDSFNLEKCFFLNKDIEIFFSDIGKLLIPNMTLLCEKT